MATAPASFSVSVDVPDLVAGVLFYSQAFGFTEFARPMPEVALLRSGAMEICLLEKPPGSPASEYTPETRHYERHWTPVHLDFHVEDFLGALAKAVHAGAECEAVHEHPERGSVAFCSDPFGHGFCLIETVAERR